MKKLICITSTIIMLAVFSLSTMSQAWTWYQDQLSIPKMGLSAAIMDDTIFYSAGKTTYGAFTNIWDMYDIDEQQWDTYETSSSPRFMYATVSAGGKVFGAGGSNYPDGDNFPDVDIYDKETGNWTVEYLTLGRTITGGAVACGNLVFFAGGHIHTGTGPMDYTKVIDIYDTEAETWFDDTLSIGRCFIGAVAAGGKVYFAGGAKGEQEVTNRIDIYDMATGEWTIDSLSEAKGLVAAVAYGDKIYFAGGAKPYGVTTTLIEVYNITTNSWEDTMNLQASRIVTALKVKNSLVFTGAADWFNFSDVGYIGPPNGVVEIYYPETNQWDYSVTNLNPERYTYAWASYANRAYYAGGFTGSAIVNTVSVLEYDIQCLPEGITFSTQEEIDNFQINYPGCIEIEGDVTINGDDITNLNGLDVLTSIGGSLIIYSNPLLTSLSGLEGLISIGESLAIKVNDALVNLTGLDNLSYIGSFVNIEDNNSLISLEGLNNLSSIGIGPYDWGLIVLDNDNLTSLSGLESLTYIEGALSIKGNYDLVSLTGLENLTSIGGYLSVSSNNELISLNGLNNLTSIGGRLSIGISGGNPALTSLAGLESLSSIGGSLTIIDNQLLSNIFSLNGVTSLGGNLTITNNDSLASLSGLENIDEASIVNLTIVDNDELYDCDIWPICQYLKDPGGTVVIENNATECNSIEEVQEHCLTSIDELNGDDSFSISPNPSSSYIKLRFMIEEQGLVICDLYEISGVKVKQLLNEEKIPGTYEMEIDLSDLPEGVYFCVLKTNDGIQTKKIIKL